MDTRDFDKQQIFDQKCLYFLYMFYTFLYVL